jgi:hypothetical protein
MSTNHRVEKQKNDPTVKAFENYGSIYGFLLGAIAGVLIAGPNFQVWPPLQSLLTILGGGIIVGVIGHIALLMALGSEAAGNTGEYADLSADDAGGIDASGD